MACLYLLTHYRALTGKVPASITVSNPDTLPYLVEGGRYPDPALKLIDPKLKRSVQNVESDVKAGFPARVIWYRCSKCVLGNTVQILVRKLAKRPSALGRSPHCHHGSEDLLLFVNFGAFRDRLLNRSCKQAGACVGSYCREALKETMNPKICNLP